MRESGRGSAWESGRGSALTGVLTQGMLTAGASAAALDTQPQQVRAAHHSRVQPGA